MAGLATAPPAADELAGAQVVADRRLWPGHRHRRGPRRDALQTLALYGIDLTEMKTYTDKVEAVTPTEVQAFAADELKPGDASLIVVGDGKLFLPTLKAPNLEVIPIAQFDPDNPTLKAAP